MYRRIRNVSSGFSFRTKCTRWLMAAVIAVWALTGGSMVPLMWAHECRDMMMSGMSMPNAATPHHGEASHSPNHECCKRKKTKPVKASMPCCPDQPGSMPRTCGMTELACCTIPSREETRRTARVEKRNGNEDPELALAKAPPGEEQRAGEQVDGNLRDGFRYERPVFDLKTDLRT